MEKFIVEKSHSLKGVIDISGSKNAALPILAACVLTDGECVIEGVPPLNDVTTMLELIRELGCKTNYEGETISVRGKDIDNLTLDYNEVKKIRASFLLAGAMLSRFGRADIALPGGCSIGLRPVDLHLKMCIRDRY